MPNEFRASVVQGHHNAVAIVHAVIAKAATEAGPDPYTAAAEAMRAVSHMSPIAWLEAARVVEQLTHVPASVLAEQASAYARAQLRDGELRIFEDLKRKLEQALRLPDPDRGRSVMRKYLRQASRRIDRLEASTARRHVVAIGLVLHDAEARARGLPSAPRSHPGDADR